MTRTRSIVMSLLGGTFAGLIVGIVGHFSSGQVKAFTGVPVAIVLTAVFYLHSRMAAATREKKLPD